MSHRFAAFAPAFALTVGLALAGTGAAQAQTPAAPAADAPGMTMPMPKMLTDMGAGSSISLREVAAIGTGVVVGAALWHVVIGHSFALAGAAIGGWIGDWCYGEHAATAAAPMHSGG